VRIVGLYCFRDVARHWRKITIFHTSSVFNARPRWG